MWSSEASIRVTSHLQDLMRNSYVFHLLFAFPLQASFSFSQCRILFLVQWSFCCEKSHEVRYSPLFYLNVGF